MTGELFQAPRTLFHQRTSQGAARPGLRVVSFLILLGVAATCGAGPPQASSQADTKRDSQAPVETFPAKVPATEPATQTPKRAEDWLPADTLFFSRFSDLGEFREQWEASSFGAQADDPAFDEFFADVVMRVSGATDGLGISMTALWTEIDGELSLAVVRNSSNQLSMIAIADFGEASSAVAMIGRLESKLRSEAADPTSIKMADTELKSWRRDQNRTLANISYFAEGGKVVFSDQVQTLAETVRAGQSSDAPSLADNPAFQHVIERIVPGGDFSGAHWYLNPSKVVDAAVSSQMAGNPNPQTVQSVIETFGLDQFRGFGGSFWLGKGNMDSVSTTYGYVETPVEGFWKAFTLPATPQRPPEWVKDDVSLYSQINWSAERFYQAVESLVDRARGEGTFDQTIGGMQVGETGLTVGELAERLVGPLHIAAEIPADARELTNQRAVFAIELKDPERLRQLVSDFAERSGAEVLQAGKNQVYHFQPEVPEFANLPPLSFAVAVTDDTLMISPNADYLGQTLSGREAMRPLADSPDYQEIAAQFPEQTSMITYQHQDSRMAGLYEQLRSGLLGNNLPGLTGQLLNFDFTKLPPWPAMSRYLQTTGSFVVPEDDGFRIVSFALPPREQ